MAHVARTLSVEFAPEGIRVNNVAPAITPTPNMVVFVSGTVGPARHPLLDPLNVSVSIPWAGSACGRHLQRRGVPRIGPVVVHHRHHVLMQGMAR